MKQLLRVLRGALAFAPLAVLLAAVNWYADPANVLRVGYERRVAEIVASGENAANLSNMDDRAFLRAYAALRTQPIDTLVLGSSHSMQITKELTGDENTFCAGMTGADLRDCISAYALLREHGFAPRRVILTVDAWFLCEQTLEGRAMTDGYEAFCAAHGLSAYKGAGGSAARAWLRRAQQTFSIPYFQSSLDFLKKGLHQNRAPVPTTAHTAQSAMRRADGSYCYAQAYREAPVETARRLAEDCIRVKPEFARGFSGVTDELARQLEAFLRQLQDDGVQTALMLPPYHPVYYAHMAAAEDYRAFLATEQVVRDMAQRLELPVFGASDPAACGLTEADFYDALHCSEEAMYRFYPAGLFS